MRQKRKRPSSRRSEMAQTAIAERRQSGRMIVQIEEDSTLPIRPAAAIATPPAKRARESQPLVVQATPISAAPQHESERYPEGPGHEGNFAEVAFIFPGISMPAFSKALPDGFGRAFGAQHCSVTSCDLPASGRCSEEAYPFGRSPFRRWPFHIQSPERTMTGRATYRTTGA